MSKISQQIVKHKILILMICVLLLIPSIFGYLHTRVNYDILYYLPEDIDTMQGQDILMAEFQKGAFAIEIVEGMSDDHVLATKAKLANIPGVADVIWYDDLFGASFPVAMLPEKIKEVMVQDDATIMAIFFEDTTSADATMEAIAKIRQVSDEQCYLSGMSAVVTDIKAMADREMPIYVLIAVVLTCIVLAIFMDCWILPLFFMLSIGMAVIYNLGSNIFLHEISYITKALSAVLQLGVTLDYSIFLWHSYQEHLQSEDIAQETAMAKAISATFSSVLGSSITTVAGFIALCFMSFTLGKDMGIVMAKGVILGVIGCVTVLPSLILTFDKLINKTRHRLLLPNMNTIAKKLVKQYRILALVFVILLFPALYGYKNTQVYYNLDKTLPKYLASIQANDKLANEFAMNATHMILADSDLASKDAKAMIKEIQEVEGVKFAIGADSIIGSGIAKEMLPDQLLDDLVSDNWQLMIVQSAYKVASDEVNTQCEQINTIIKKYDDNAMLIGEAPCTKDLINITNNDFKVVSAISIVLIFLIIAISFKSLLLPVILVAVIELAIFINMGIPYYTHTELPFIASIVIGTIQLGATVDYAILMTTRYKKERCDGKKRQEAVEIALATSINSIIVSALGFFAATFGVGLYSDIDMISALCLLMARGAIISMFVVILILPAMLMVFDRMICHTTAQMTKIGG
ncbi:MAG: efflux RND transporter permease subunit [Erysipelotrichaceae bacterium]|nr:efflux RND transporter permease subunit [Erysipelotrichaceae bacterium]MDY5252409.1 efflux RND transporter permease subunit [Erysipelotrichaceae bacterium]